MIPTTFCVVHTAYFLVELVFLVSYTVHMRSPYISLQIPGRRQVDVDFLHNKIEVNILELGICIH